MTIETGEVFRDNFLRSFTLERHLSGLAEAFAQVEAPRPVTVPAAAASSVSK
jgi:hypothetical protein